MGQFSWIAQDTDEQICSTEGHQRTVYMKDDRGNVWREDNYDGYGVFGGKDYFTLLSEMNPDPDIDLIRSDDKAHSDDDRHRLRGIRLFYGWAGQSEEYKAENPIKTPCLFHNRLWDWNEEHPEDDPNQGWYEEPTCCGCDRIVDEEGEWCDEC